MLLCELVKAEDLSARDHALWHEMMAVTEAFGSPILSPEFARAVARVRPDVYVAIFRKNGRTLGYLPHHRRPNRFARPAGAPFADYSALISFPDPDITIQEALRAADIDQYQAIGLIDPYNVFGDVQGEDDEAYGIDLSFDEPVNNVNKKQVKNINRIRRNLTEAHGEVGFIMPDRDPEHFARMLQLKQTQTHQSGLHDFLGAPWVERFLKMLFEAPLSGLHGSMITLTAGDKPLLFHFGVRLGDRAHPWVSSFDPAYSAFSPGQIFLNDCQVPLKAAGIRYYDLSTGQQHYKSSFCNTHFPVKHARLYSDAPSARLSQNVARFTATTQKAMGAGVEQAFARLARRVDQIACLELDTLSRAKGIAFAFSNASKRLKAVDNG